MMEALDLQDLVFSFHNAEIKLGVISQQLKNLSDQESALSRELEAYAPAKIDNFAHLN